MAIDNGQSHEHHLEDGDHGHQMDVDSSCSGLFDLDNEHHQENLKKMTMLCIYIYIYTRKPYKMHHNDIHIDHAIYALEVLIAQIKPIILLVLTIQICLSDLISVSQYCGPYHLHNQVSDDHKGHPATADHR